MLQQYPPYLLVKESITATPNRQLPRIDFGDILTLLFYCLLISSVVVFFYGLNKKRSLFILSSSGLMGLAAFLSIWSIGIILVFIALMQLVVSIYFLAKKL
ncbi:MAG: hypothetical protein K9L17_07230 [Clostridiales bacterium]|nr:hypothetical protein [Clostridiales bacterium]MCF8022464.1 hypothetical protein [Clostridiales bacterium]